MNEEERNKLSEKIMEIGFDMVDMEMHTAEISGRVGPYTLTVIVKLKVKDIRA